MCGLLTQQLYLSFVSLRMRSIRKLIHVCARPYYCAVLRRVGTSTQLCVEQSRKWTRIVAGFSSVFRANLTSGQFEDIYLSVSMFPRVAACLWMSHAYFWPLLLCMNTSRDKLPYMFWSIYCFVLSAYKLDYYKATQLTCKLYGEYSEVLVHVCIEWVSAALERNYQWETVLSPSSSAPYHQSMPEKVSNFDQVIARLIECLDK